MRLKRLLIPALALFLSFPLVAQTTFSSGEIAVIGADGQTVNDEFTFVILVDMEAGTKFYFTDIDLDGTDTIPNGDGNDGCLGYTASQDLPKGTVIRYDETSPAAEFSASFNGTFEYAGGGDAVTLYQGADSINDVTFLHIAGRDGYFGTPPTGFTDVTNFGTDHEGEYEGLKNSTASDLWDSILNVAHWNTTTTGIGSALDETAFRVGYFWDGTAWSPSNPGGVGSAFDDDVIVAGTGATVSGNTETNNDVFIDPAATLDLGANTLTADSVFIQSSATGQGQLVGSVTADVCFETYITSTDSARWFNVGFPVDGALSKITLTNGGIIRTDADGPTANANVYWYDPTTVGPGPAFEGTWTVAADQTPAADANGWAIYLGDTTFGMLPMTISAYGTLNSGDFGAAISTANGGWNFMNNPYAGSLDLDEVDNDNPTMDDTYYIRDDENEAWVSYNGFSNVGTRYAAAGQAFFISTSTPTTLNFEEDQVVVTETPSLASSVSPENIVLNVSNSLGKSDYTVVTLKSGATDQTNAIIDGLKKMNSGTKVPNIFTSLQGQDYVYKFIDDSFTKRTVPVSLTFSIDDELTINLDMATVDPGMQIHLEDKLSGDITDLRAGAYTFRHLAANSPDRFVLHLNKSSIGIGEAGDLASNIFAYASGASIFVNLEDIEEEVSVQIFDMGGKMILDEAAIGGQVEQFSLPNQSQGVYLLQVLAHGQVIHSQKIMK